MTQEALKLALEALYPIAHNTTDDPRDQAYKAIAAIKQALAQPEQEPVAYVNVEKRRLEFAEPMVWHTPTVVNLERIPLYTQQRTWVGLTDEDKAILEAVHRELDRDCYEGNAPGHSHRTKGVWDEDNGKLAGKPCAWCLTWAKFTTLIKNEAAHGIKGET